MLCPFFFERVESLMSSYRMMRNVDGPGPLPAGPEKNSRLGDLELPLNIYFLFMALFVMSPVRETEI